MMENMQKRYAAITDFHLNMLTAPKVNADHFFLITNLNMWIYFDLRTVSDLSLKIENVHIENVFECVKTA